MQKCWLVSPDLLIFLFRSQECVFLCSFQIVQCWPWNRIKNNFECTGLPTWNFCLPNKYPYPANLPQMSIAPRNFFWLLLPCMCLSLCYSLVSATLVFCTHMLLYLSSCQWVSWEQGPSLPPLCNTDPSAGVKGFHDHERKKKWLVHKTRRVTVPFVVRRKVLKTKID